MSSIRCLLISMVSIAIICSCSKINENKHIVSQALKITKEHAIHSETLDWSSIEQDVLQQADQVSSEKELYQVLQMLINRLGDNHSFLLTAEGKRWQRVEKKTPAETKRTEPRAKLRNAKIAYIEVNPMSSAAKQDMKTYAQTLYQTIIAAYHEDMTGWILDFRENTGGQLWPMLAGLSPLINSDIAGNAIYPNGDNWQWWAKNGKAGVGENIHHQVDRQSDPVMSEKPIAILISNRTASSGEASVVSFIGKKGVCLIGEQTRGLATVNQPYELANGITLMLTSAYFGDRNKRVYPNGIEPGIIVDNNAANDIDNDIQLNTAIEWLEKQSGR